MTREHGRAAGRPVAHAGRTSAGAGRASSSSGSCGSASPWSSRSCFPVLLLCIFGSVFNQDIAPGVTFSQYFVAGMVAERLRQQRLPGPGHRDRHRAGQRRAQAAVRDADAARGLLRRQVPARRSASRSSRSRCSSPSGCSSSAWTCPTRPAGSPSPGSPSSACCRRPCWGSRSRRCRETADSAPALITPIVLVLQFISGVFFVYTELPTWMQQHRGRLPAQVADPGHALGLPARHLRGRGGLGVVAALAGSLSCWSSGRSSAWCCACAPSAGSAAARTDLPAGWDDRAGRLPSAGQLEPHVSRARDAEA